MFSLIKIRNVFIFFVCFVLATKTYVIFAKLLSVPVSVITGTFFVFCILLISVRLHSVKQFFSSIFGCTILLLSLITPIIVGVINLRLNLNQIFLQLFYVSIVIVGIGYQKEIFKQKSFLIYAMYFNLIAGLFSMVFPQFFNIFSEVINSRSEYYGRAIAFYLQPNGLGAGTILIYCIGSFLYPKDYIKKILFPCMLTVLITASRSSMVVIIAVIAIQYFAIMSVKEGRQFGITKKLFKIVLVSAGSLIIGILLFLNSSLAKSEEFRAFKNRMEFYITALDQVQQLSKDGSMGDREEFQLEYKKNIKKNFFTGHGFSIQKEDIKKGKLIGKAHNEYLELLYQGGIIYLFIYIIFLLVFFIQAWRFKTSHPIIFGTFIATIFYLILYGFLINTLYNIRLLYLLLGLMISSEVFLNKKKLKNWI